jgi:hypothetical protein
MHTAHPIVTGVIHLYIVEREKPENESKGEHFLRRSEILVDCRQKEPTLFTAA